MANMVKLKVVTGQYATESEVIREGLRALAERDGAVEQWLRDQVVPVAQALKADPSRALSAGQVRQHLADKRKRADPSLA